MSSAFGTQATTQSTDTAYSTNTQQSADLISGINNAAMANGTNTVAPSTFAATPTAGMNKEAINPFGSGSASPLQIVTGTSTAVTTSTAPQTISTYADINGHVTPTTETVQGAHVVTTQNPTSTQSVNSNALPGNPAASTAAALQAYNAQQLADSSSTAALIAGLQAAGGSSANTAAAAAANSQLYRDTFTAAHGAGVWGAQAANTAQGGNAAIAAGNTQLGQAQDLVNNAQNQEQYLSTTLQSELANHQVDAQTAIANMNTTISGLQAELQNAQGADAVALKAQLNEITQAINNLQGSTAASQLGTSEWWSVFGTVASAAAKIAPAAALL